MAKGSAQTFINGVITHFHGCLTYEYKPNSIVVHTLPMLIYSVKQRYLEQITTYIPNLTKKSRMS